MPMTLKEYLKDFEITKIRYCLDVICDGIQTFVSEAEAHYKYSLDTPTRPHSVQYGHLRVSHDLTVFKEGGDHATFWLSERARLVIWPL